MNFETLGLKKELLKAIDTLGFKEATPIQEKAIPQLLDGDRDFLGQAQTGSGKTGAFGLPLIQNIDYNNSSIQGIIMCPTRELCMQITEDLKVFTKYLKQVKIVAVYGGASITKQIQQIKNKPHIIVATPGRLLDLLNRKAFNLSKISFAVLDEADEMLNMGFQEDIDTILSKMPETKNIWLFCATMPKSVATIARNYMKDPIEAKVGNKNLSPDTINHTCYVIHEKNRYQGLKRIIDFTPDIFGMVFCRTRKETQAIAEALMGDGYQAEALHGDLSQSQRDYVMRKFRHGSVKILVATDVAARGIDIEDISHVINYNLPDEAETYTHRSGRTARAGKSGQSIVFINTREVRKVRELEKKLKLRFEFGKIPQGKSICERQLFSMVDKVVNADVSQDEISEYLPVVYNKLKEFDKEDLIKRFVSAEFNRFLEYYCGSEDINVKNIRLNADNSNKYNHKKEKGKSAKPKRNLNAKKTQRFFINVGKLDKIKEGAIIRLVCDRSGISSSNIGQIDLKREFSFFEVEKSLAKRVQKSLKNARLDGRQVQVQEVVNGKKEHKSKELIY